MLRLSKSIAQFFLLLALVAWGSGSRTTPLASFT